MYGEMLGHSPSPETTNGPPDTSLKLTESHGGQAPGTPASLGMDLYLSTDDPSLDSEMSGSLDTEISEPSSDVTMTTSTASTATVAKKRPRRQQASRPDLLWRYKRRKKRAKPKVTDQTASNNKLRVKSVILGAKRKSVRSARLSSRVASSCSSTSTSSTAAGSSVHPVTGATSAATLTQRLRDLWASIPGFSPKKLKPRKKMSTVNQLQLSRQGWVDLESPSSMLAYVDLRMLIRRETLMLLPPRYRSNLAQLLPACDRLSKASLTSLSNEFFSQSCQEWTLRLAEGEFTAENQLRVKNEEEREMARLDPWKVRHFEPVWGQNSHNKQVKTGKRRHHTRHKDSVVDPVMVENKPVDNPLACLKIFHGEIPVNIPAPQPNISLVRPPVSTTSSVISSVKPTEPVVASSSALDTSVTTYVPAPEPVVETKQTAVGNNIPLLRHALMTPVSPPKKPKVPMRTPSPPFPLRSPETTVTLDRARPQPTLLSPKDHRNKPRAPHRVPAIIRSPPNRRPANPAGDAPVCQLVQPAPPPNQQILLAPNLPLQLPGVVMAAVPQVIYTNNPAAAEPRLLMPSVPAGTILVSAPNAAQTSQTLLVAAPNAAQSTSQTLLVAAPNAAQSTSQTLLVAAHNPAQNTPQTLLVAAPQLTSQLAPKAAPQLATNLQGKRIIKAVVIKRRNKETTASTLLRTGNQSAPSTVVGGTQQVAATADQLAAMLGATGQLTTTSQGAPSRGFQAVNQLPSVAQLAAALETNPQLASTAQLAAALQASGQLTSALQGTVNQGLPTVTHTSQLTQQPGASTPRFIIQGGSVSLAVDGAPVTSAPVTVAQISPTTAGQSGSASSGSRTVRQQLEERRSQGNIVLQFHNYALSTDTHQPHGQ